MRGAVLWMRVGTSRGLDDDADGHGDEDGEEHEEGEERHGEEQEMVTHPNDRMWQSNGEEVKRKGFGILCAGRNHDSSSSSRSSKSRVF